MSYMICSIKSAHSSSNCVRSFVLEIIYKKLYPRRRTLVKRNRKITMYHTEPCQRPRNSWRRQYQNRIRRCSWSYGLKRKWWPNLFYYSRNCKWWRKKELKAALAAVSDSEMSSDVKNTISKMFDGMAISVGQGEASISIKENTSEGMIFVHCIEIFEVKWSERSFHDCWGMEICLCNDKC